MKVHQTRIYPPILSYLYRRKTLNGKAGVLLAQWLRNSCGVAGHLSWFIAEFDTSNFAFSWLSENTMSQLWDLIADEVKSRGVHLIHIEIEKWIRICFCLLFCSDPVFAAEWNCLLFDTWTSIASLSLWHKVILSQLSPVSECATCIFYDQFCFGNQNRTGPFSACAVISDKEIVCQIPRILRQSLTCFWFWMQVELKTAFWGSDAKSSWGRKRERKETWWGRVAGLRRQSAVLPTRTLGGNLDPVGVVGTVADKTYICSSRCLFVSGKKFSTLGRIFFRRVVAQHTDERQAVMLCMSLVSFFSFVVRFCQSFSSQRTWQKWHEKPRQSSAATIVHEMCVLICNHKLSIDLGNSRNVSIRHHIVRSPSPRRACFEQRLPVFQQCCSLFLRNFGQAMDVLLFQLSEWSKNDERLAQAVQENDLNKVDTILLKKRVIPTKLDQHGTTLWVQLYIPCTQHR